MNFPRKYFMGQLHTLSMHGIAPWNLFPVLLLIKTGLVKLTKAFVINNAIRFNLINTYRCFIYIFIHSFIHRPHYQIKQHKNKINTFDTKKKYNKFNFATKIFYG